MTQRVLNSPHDDLADAIEQIEDGEPVLLEHDGKPLAAIISITDLRLLEAYFEELEDRIDREEAAKALADMAREGTVPYDTVRRELGLDGE
jgi:antitoxin (DNA-binding transcriptional repressor) of toxin-antitoxin stability system